MNLRNKLDNLPQNTKKLFSNTAAAFAIKGVSLLISMLTTPAFIRYFSDNTVLGVWYTMLSVLSWFLNFDLGIGNGIRNNLVKNIAENDYVQAKKTISSGVFSTGIVALLLGCMGVGVISLLDLHKLFNVEPNIIPSNVLYFSTIIVFAAIVLRFFLTTVSSVFYALQKSAINNFLALIVSILQFVFVKTVNCSSPSEGLAVLSVAYLLIANVPVLLAGIIVFHSTLKQCRPNFKFVDKTSTKQIMGIGSVFFVCQLFHMVIMNTNSFLITNRFGAEYTTEYEFYYKLTSLVSMIVTLAITPIWSMVTKAISEKDYSWLSKVYWVMKIIGVFTVVLQFLLVPIEQWIMNIWLGESSIEVQLRIGIAFACFGSVFVYSSILSTIVCGMARMKIQAVMYGIGAIVKIVVVVLLSKITTDWSVVVWSNVIVLLPYCIIQQIDLDRYMKKLLKEEIK